MKIKLIPLFVLLVIIKIDSFGQLPKDTTVQNFQMDGTDTVFTKVDQYATFPDGANGWRRYLERNLHYPRQAQKKSIQGAVRVQMEVTKEGIVTHVKALNEPGGGLGQEAARVIKDGPNWIPAVHNGRNVNYRFAQTITFQLQ